MKRLLLILVALQLILTACTPKMPTALIVTGQNNHAWKISHVILKQLLDDSGKFGSVDLAISPAEGGDMESFTPEFSKYDVVVIDYNGDSWCDKCKSDFEEYLANKGGVVIYHASNNAFADWDTFENVIALGGWGGRGAQTPGVYVEWKDNKLVKYEASGTVGSHGARGDFTVNIRNNEHPITAGLPATMPQKDDEIYDHMKGVGNIKDVLCTAHSNAEKGGAGKEEVLVFTVEHPTARIFHTMLGHAQAENPQAMATEIFIETYIRGTLWAAGEL